MTVKVQGGQAIVGGVDLILEELAQALVRAAAQGQPRLDLREPLEELAQGLGVAVVLGRLRRLVEKLDLAPSGLALGKDRRPTEQPAKDIQGQVTPTLLGLAGLGHLIGRAAPLDHGGPRLLGSNQPLDGHVGQLAVSPVVAPLVEHGHVERLPTFRIRP